MKSRSIIYLIFVLSLIVLAVLQLLLVKFSLYWLYRWLDIPMHALGGAVVALGFLAFVPRYTHGRFFDGLLMTLGFVAVIGIGWEVYEFLTGIALAETAPLRDTLGDIVMDFVGGSIGYVVARALIRLESHNDG